MNRQALGRLGEDLAAVYLEERGYCILERNVRTRHGEIDLIAEKAGVRVFVEVKLRSGVGYGLPEEAVTAQKRKHILDAIAAYWQAKAEEIEWRVDVLAILRTPGSDEVQVEHFENALTE